MRDVLRWVLIGAALLVVGPVVGRMVAGLRAPDGGPDATMFLSETPAQSIGLTIVGVALAGGMGAATSRLMGARMGMLTAGLVLAWAAWHSATVKGVLQWSRSGKPLSTLALEGALLGAIGVGIAWVICRVGRKREGEESPAPIGSGAGIGGFAVAIIAGGVAAWVLGREGLKGQALASAIGAGLVGATVGHVVMHRAPAVVFVAAMGALAAAGPLLGAVIHGDEIIAIANHNRLFPLTWPAPLDWLAGAFLGAPLGMTWGASMLEKRAETA